MKFAATLPLPLLTTCYMFSGYIVNEAMITPQDML